MGLQSITGESIYAAETYYVSSETLVSKSFLCKNSIYPNSVTITWNGLTIPSNSYVIIGNRCVLNADFPLTLSDEIICRYTIGE